MKESVTYQAILEEGEEKGKLVEVKKVVRLLAERRFGPADAKATAALNRINDLQRLEGLTLKVAETSSWQELLDLPKARRRRPPMS